MYQLKIRMQRGKYVVVQVNGNTERPIHNWKHYAAEAKQVVLEQSGTTMHEGLYDLSNALARKVGMAL